MSWMGTMGRMMISGMQMRGGKYDSEVVVGKTGSPPQYEQNHPNQNDKKKRKMKIQENLGETRSLPPQYEQNHHPNHQLLDQQSALKCNDQTIARVRNCPNITTLRSSGRVRVTAVRIV